MMDVKIRIDGLEGLDRALAELSKTAARGVLKRTLVKASQPMVDMASRLAPDDPATGPPDLHSSIAASSKIKNTIGNKEYHDVMSNGGTRTQARAALVAARQDAAGAAAGSFAVVFVGPRSSTKRAAIKAIVQEFGSVKQSARPYMRPAWDATKNQVLQNISVILKDEVAKSVARARARALKKAASA